MKRWLYLSLIINGILCGGISYCILKYPEESAFTVLALGTDTCSESLLLYKLNELRRNKITKETLQWLVNYSATSAVGSLRLFAELNIMLDAYPWLRSQLQTSQEGKFLLNYAELNGNGIQRELYR